MLKTNELFGNVHSTWMGQKTRTKRRFLKTRPDARTEAQKEDMSGQTRTYGNPRGRYIAKLRFRPAHVHVHTVSHFTIFVIGAFIVHHYFSLLPRQKNCFCYLNPSHHNYYRITPQPSDLLYDCLRDCFLISCADRSCFSFIRFINFQLSWLFKYSCISWSKLCL